MRWEILVLSQPARAEFLAQLLSLLNPQLLGHPEVDTRIVLDDNWSRAMEVGEKREFVRQQSRAEYINFVDDDDLIAPNYIERILPLLDGIDQVGFRVEAWQGERKLQPTTHSLKCGPWYMDAKGFYRDISHICPMRRELAMQVPISGGYGEDFRWANGMRALGIVKTESFLDEIMYYYLIREPKNDAIEARDPRRLALIESLRCQPSTT